MNKMEVLNKLGFYERQVCKASKENSGKLVFHSRCKYFRKGSEEVTLDNVIEFVYNLGFEYGKENKMYEIRKVLGIGV